MGRGQGSEQEGVAATRRGGARSIDSNFGSPVSAVLHHQTDAEAAERLRAGEWDSSRSTGYFGAGLYLSREESEDGMYGDESLHFQVSLARPFDAGDDDGLELFDEIETIVRERIGRPDGTVDWQLRKAAAITDELVSRGYDGVLTSEGDVVVFGPESIKSGF